MSIKAGRVGVNPVDVDVINGRIKGNTSAYTKDEVDAKFATFNDVENEVQDVYEVMGDNGAINLLENTATSDSEHTINADKSVTVTGSLSANYYKVGELKVKPNTQYKLWQGGSVNSNCSLRFRTRQADYTVNATYWGYNGTQVITTEANADTIDVYIVVSQTVSGQVFYPMITPPSYTGPYHPYAMTNAELTDKVKDIEQYIIKLNLELLAASSFGDFQSRMTPTT